MSWFIGAFSNPDLYLNLFAGLLIFLLEFLLVATLLPRFLSSRAEKKIEEHWRSTRALAGERALQAVSDILHATEKLTGTLETLATIKEGANATAGLKAVIEGGTTFFHETAERLQAMPGGGPLPPKPELKTNPPAPTMTSADRASLKTLQVRTPVEEVLRAMTRLQNTLDLFTPALTPDMIVEFVALYDHIARAEPYYHALQVLFVDDSPSREYLSTASNASIDPDVLIQSVNRICDLTAIAKDDRQVAAVTANVAKQRSVSARFVKAHFNYPPPLEDVDLSDLEDFLHSPSPSTKE
jgi:hypothetical protein